MRLFWLLIVLVLAGLFLHLNPEYKTRLMELASDAGSTFSPAGKTTRLYKWRNAEGTLQITDQPPSVDIEYETLDYHQDTNILPQPPQLQNK
ncbi:MAG: DUF4124 domain-containing protein [Gammaproteobacteria bacterium]|nr:DUF4124 domain-containing protein [Gammaproteobacteria bacterium]MDH3559526.1 DUF4124 domain-containing protein [Gammaproteobacteria bacterium]